MRTCIDIDLREVSVVWVTLLMSDREKGWERSGERRGVGRGGGWLFIYTEVGCSGEESRRGRLVGVVLSSVSISSCVSRGEEAMMADGRNAGFS